MVVHGVRLITRNDASLTVALIAAATILFQQPLRRVLDLVQNVEGRLHLDLLPALLLLVVVFAFHQYRKRMQAWTDAVAAAADAEQARTQSDTLQQLMGFSRALANALDRATLQQVLWKHLPPLAREQRFWVLLRRGDQWDVVMQDTGDDPRPAEHLERLAMRALHGEKPSEERAVRDPQDPLSENEDLCFPLLAADSVVGVLGVAGASRLAPEQRSIIGAVAAMIAISIKNMQLFIDTRESSVRDDLTGCFNRTYALTTLDLEMRRSRRTGNPLSILMFDVDHFKSVNDQFGHLWGDEVLGAIGAQLSRLMRSTDVRCRYGGDEFLIFLPDTPSLGAQQVAETLRQEIAAVKIGPDSHPIGITISIGVAAVIPGELDAKALIHRADKALYRAKHAGRNRASVAVPPSMADAHGVPARRDDRGESFAERSASVG